MSSWTYAGKKKKHQPWLGQVLRSHAHVDPEWCLWTHPIAPKKTKDSLKILTHPCAREWVWSQSHQAHFRGGTTLSKYKANEAISKERLKHPKRKNASHNAVIWWGFHYTALHKQGLLSSDISSHLTLVKVSLKWVNPALKFIRTCKINLSLVKLSLT